MTLELDDTFGSALYSADERGELPVEAVQFHPESVLTQYGHRMLANWLAEAGGSYPEALLVELEDEQAGYQRAFDDVVAG